MKVELDTTQMLGYKLLAGGNKEEVLSAKTGDKAVTNPSMNDGLKMGVKVGGKPVI